MESKSENLKDSEDLDIKNQDIRSIHSHVGASTLWACNVYVVLSLVSMGESPPFLQYLF